MDGASFPSTYAHRSHKIYELGNWFAANMAPGTQACPLVVDIDAWKKPPTRLTDAKAPAYEKLKATDKVADDEFIPPIKQKKPEFVTDSEADLARFRSVRS